MPDESCYIELFGGLTVRQGERTVARFETRKVAALLACLCLPLERAHPREVLAEHLWPDEDWDAIRSRLRCGQYHAYLERRLL